MGTKFRQRVGRCSTSLDFGEEELAYTFESGTKAGSTVAYHKIPQRTVYREVGMWWYKYFLLFYVTFCIIIGIYYDGLDDLDMLIRVPYFATLLFLCITFAGIRLRRPGMTSFALNPPLIILHDGHQPGILGEILKRRAAMMRQKLAWVDTTKPYYEEASKFSWLREEGIVSEQEYGEARKKIAAMREKVPHRPGGPVN